MERRTDNASSKARASREGDRSPCSVHWHTVAEAALRTRKNPQLLPTGFFSLLTVVMSLPPLSDWNFTLMLSPLVPEASLAKISTKGKARTY